MQFIPYSGDTHNTPEVLRNRRDSLRLTQQQVANGAKLLLQQYQRLESGERRHENASLKVALPICAVLKIDPFQFLDGSQSMNTYAESIKKMDYFLEELFSEMVSYNYDRESAQTPDKSGKIREIAGMISSLLQEKWLQRTETRLQRTDDEQNNAAEGERGVDSV